MTRKMMLRYQLDTSEVIAIILRKQQLVALFLNLFKQIFIAIFAT